MGRLARPQTHASTEFDLDLAPLLAVMVKLVPVLLISSAFVQMMVIETELPQLVKDAVEQQELKTQTQITLEMDTSKGFDIIIRNEAGEDKLTNVPLADGKWDYPTLHVKLREIKAMHPQVFKLNFAPGDSVNYQDLIKATDEARKARDPQVVFEVEDAKTHQKSKTGYMFPEITFVNMLEG